MSLFPEASFLTSANDVGQLVDDAGSEVAFAGRSNAGKSSAINTIVNRKQFARISKTPGRTQLINFFAVGPEQRLVDLPGYGYAKVSTKMRQHWKQLMERYFAERRSLSGMFLIVDVRRGIGDFDEQMLAFGEALGVSCHVLLTKADKLKRGQAASQLLQNQRLLSGRASAQLFSSLNRQGLDEARDKLRELLERHPA